MGGLVELLGVEGSTNAEGDSLAEKDVVGDGSNTTVVDLALFVFKNPFVSFLPGVETTTLYQSASSFLRAAIVEKRVGKNMLRGTNLDEGDGVQAVLAGDLEADGASALGVPGGLSTGLDLAVDLVVVAGAEDAQVVGGGDGGGVARGEVADSGAVAGDLALLDVVAGAGAGEEALVADDGVDVGGGALEEVEEGTAVEVGLLEVQVELGTAGLGGGQEGEDTLGLETLGKAVGELELALKGVGGVPGLGEGQACAVVKH